MTDKTDEQKTQTPKKTPTRPGSQWATGKRRTGKSQSEQKGFARGARTL